MTITLGRRVGTGVDVAMASRVDDMAVSTRRASTVAATPAAILSASDSGSVCVAQAVNASSESIANRQYLIIN